MKKKILIFGITGQDGSYAAELFLKKKYEVHGLIRKSSTSNTVNIDHIINNKKIFGKDFFIHPGDLLDSSSIENVIKTVLPNEIYNFADQDHVRWSFDLPVYSFNTTATSLISIFEILKRYKNIKFFQPLSSNIFGLTNQKSQDENSIINPQSIYALGKTSALYTCRLYRDVFGLKIYSAIFFNHESPRRPIEYVSRKITNTAAKIFLGKTNKLYLGNIETKIDWGFAADYVEAAWKIMQLKNPTVMVIGTGKLYKIKDFLKFTFELLNLDYRDYVHIDKKLFRPSATSYLKPNLTKAKKLINFKPKTDLHALIEKMVKNDLEVEKR